MLKILAERNTWVSTWFSFHLSDFLAPSAGRLVPASTSRSCGRKSNHIRQTSFHISAVSSIANCLPYIQFPSRQNKAYRLEYKAKQGSVFVWLVFFPPTEFISVHHGAFKHVVANIAMYRKPVHHGFKMVKFARSLQYVAEECAGCHRKSWAPFGWLKITLTSFFQNKPDRSLPEDYLMFSPDVQWIQQLRPQIQKYM